MNIKLYQIDAFANKVFGGNPAAVCPLDEWIDDELLLNIAKENNLAETAYFTKLDNGHFHIRWFTPELEMDLCGHATLATAFVIFNELNYRHETITFESKSGLLKVSRSDNFIELDFPSRPPLKADIPKIISDAFSIQPIEVLKSRDYLFIYNSVDDILNLKIDTAIFNQINLGPGGVIVSAESQSIGVDFVSRFFTPQASALEDPVTGSAHCTLIPYWAGRLGKNELHAHQLSERRGELFCTFDNDRVYMKGSAVKYLEGQIIL